MKTEIRTCLLPFTLKLLTRLIHASCRIKIISKHENHTRKAVNPKSIYAFWHGCFLSVLFEFRKKNISVLASPSKDGELIASVLQDWNYNLIRGSSSKQPEQAYKDCINLLNNNNSLAITPDGPRGPYRKAHSGVVRMAIETEAKVIPIACESSRYIELKSWDKYRIPLPFSTIYLLIGDEIQFNSEEEKEGLKNREIKKPLLKFEEAMNNLNSKCRAIADGKITP